MKLSSGKKAFLTAGVCLAALIAVGFFYGPGSARAYAAKPPSGRPGKKIVVSSPSLPKSRKGLRVYKPEKAYNGSTLFCGLTRPSSGSPGRAVYYPIYLIDMEGSIQHLWILTPAPSVSFGRLTDKGTLFYITNDVPSPSYPEPKNSGIREIDPESRVLWFYPGFIQHDFQIIDDTTFLILRDELVYAPYPEKSKVPYLICPRTEIIDRDGNVLWRWRSEDHLDELEALTGLELPYRQFFEPELDREWPERDPFGGPVRACEEALRKLPEEVRKRNIRCIYPPGDWAHGNTCEIIPPNPVGEKDPRFKEGNIIFSFPTIDTIGVIDYPSGKIVWAWGPGELDGQHTPTVLDNGHLLIFDNGPKRGWSRVIEVDPLAEEIVWEYHGDPKISFFSTMLSNADRLPNGNTLICEGLQDRIFEITPEGEIVWDYVSTITSVEGGLGIYRAYRYPPETLEKIKSYQEPSAGR
ncbi:MAG: hypothetical protein GF408_04325 [Candidatus Omnitrophica bacterium]|nr:hypothetical protein [Candidatus Omnitrophota bacterium]